MYSLNRKRRFPASHIGSISFFGRVGRAFLSLARDARAHTLRVRLCKPRPSRPRATKPNIGAIKFPTFSVLQRSRRRPRLKLSAQAAKSRLGQPPLHFSQARVYMRSLSRMKATKATKAMKAQLNRVIQWFEGSLFAMRLSIALCGFQPLLPPESVAMDGDSCNLFRITKNPWYAAFSTLLLNLFQPLDIPL